LLKLSIYLLQPQPLLPQAVPLGCPSAQAVEQYCLPPFSMAAVRLTAHRQEGQAHFVWVAVVIWFFLVG